MTVVRVARDRDDRAAAWPPESTKPRSLDELAISLATVERRASCLSGHLAISTSFCIAKEARPSVLSEYETQSHYRPSLGTLYPPSPGSEISEGTPARVFDSTCVLSEQLLEFFQVMSHVGGFGPSPLVVDRGHVRRLPRFVVVESRVPLRQKRSQRTVQHPNRDLPERALPMLASAKQCLDRDPGGCPS